MPDDVDRAPPARSRMDRPLADFRPPSSRSPELELESETTGPRRRMFSPLTARILAVNLTAPVLLVLGLLFLDQYADSLIATELEALTTQGKLIEGSLAEGALVVETESSDFPVFTPNGAQRTIDVDNARSLLHRQAADAKLRARLYDRGGMMIADSQQLLGPGGSGSVQVLDLPPPESLVDRLFQRFYQATIGRFSYERNLPPYHESDAEAEFPEVKHALDTGEADAVVRLREDNGEKILSVAIPVQYLKQVVGVILVSRDGRAVDKKLFAVRRSILGMFVWVLGLTVLTSLYLASTIARPVRLLARAAEQVRLSKRRQYSIPDLTTRSDEIGELSAALRDMTESLWSRMDAIEQFAADVAHEIKNPLTSLRSAVETVARIQNPEHQKRLMAIIVDDVGRLDRLISDITDASRLDAELSRAEATPVKLRALVTALAEIQNATDVADAPRVAVVATGNDEFLAPGLEGRLGQVFRNLIGNAMSFSPPRGTITVRISRDGPRVNVAVEDEGPGIPPGKERAIFGRFYSERPEGEKFGTHSGLGLSISKQIVDAHQGTIYAENIVDGDGQIRGARFVVRLPAV